MLCDFNQDNALTDSPLVRVLRGKLHSSYMVAVDVTPSFPPAGIRAGRLFCASARLKQWAA